MQLISIIIPVYNHLAELKQALQSVKKQTYHSFEVIIVDDGSAEPVEEQIDRREFEFALRFHRQVNRGAPAARNVGFNLAKGELVIFWDADVVADPQLLQKMHNVLSIHPEASYVYSDFFYGKRQMRGEKFDADKLRERNYIMTTSLMRREAFSGYDEKLKRFQDWDLWLSMAEQGKIGIYIPEFLFKVIPHKGGISSYLPSFAYKKPWRYLPVFRKKVKAYEAAKKIIIEKHNLPC